MNAVICINHTEELQNHNNGGRSLYDFSLSNQSYFICIVITFITKVPNRNDTFKIRIITIHGKTSLQHVFHLPIIMFKKVICPEFCL